MKQNESELEIRKLLKQKNVKLTLPRITIYQILQNSDKGLSAYDIENQLLKTNNRINLATIYAVLKLYHGIGLVQRCKVDFNHTLYFFCSHKEFIRVECNNCGYTHFSNNADLENKIQELCTQFNIKSTSYNLTILAESCEKCQKP